MQPQVETATLSLPSKVEALITDIKTLPPNQKWYLLIFHRCSDEPRSRSLIHRSIIFSTWRLTLDIVEAGLEQISLRSVRFDGKVPQKERQNIIDRFKTDPSIRVMLLALSCGAAG